jgi:hypothetical protein
MKGSTVTQCSDPPAPEAHSSLDHVAGAFAIGLRRLEPWPLDPDLAQAEALTELIERVRVAPSEPVEHVGPNERPRRVRWTARKVVRVVRAIQDRWIAHLDGQGPRPMPPFADDDAEGDAEPPTEAELERLVEVDARLRRAASHDTKAPLDGRLVPLLPRPAHALAA